MSDGMIIFLTVVFFAVVSGFLAKGSKKDRERGQKIHKFWDKKEKK